MNAVTLAEVLGTLDRTAAPEELIGPLESCTPLAKRVGTSAPLVPLGSFLAAFALPVVGALLYSFGLGLPGAARTVAIYAAGLSTMAAIVFLALAFAGSLWWIVARQKGSQGALSAASILRSIGWSGPVRVKVHFLAPNESIRAASKCERIVIEGQTTAGTRLRVLVRQHAEVSDGYRTIRYSAADVLEVTVVGADGRRAYDWTSRKPGLAPPLAPAMVHSLHRRLGMGSPVLHPVSR